MGNTHNNQQRHNKDGGKQEKEVFGPEESDVEIEAAFEHAAAGAKYIDKSSFQRLWPQNAVLSLFIYEHMVRQYSCSPAKDQLDGVCSGLSLLQYTEQSHHILHMLSSNHQLQMYFSVFAAGKDFLTTDDGEAMIKLCNEISWVHLKLPVPELQATNCSSPDAVMQGLFGCEDRRGIEDFARWNNQHCSRMFHPLHQLTCQALRGKLDVERQDAQAERSVEIKELHKNDQCLLDMWTLWLLAVTLPDSYLSKSTETFLGTEQKMHSCLGNILSEDGWHLLYSSSTQGLSPNRFQHHVFAYKGPTVTLIWFNHHVYCIALDQEWRESSQKWGGMDCVLYSLKPQFKHVQGGAAMVYFNIQDRSQPKGLKLGKDHRTIMFEVTDDFSKVKHYGVEYRLDAVEVWGCGGKRALEEQAEQKQWEHKETEKHKQRKLKLEDWKDNPDREILSMGGVTTEHAKR